jgi:hypothetical protein
LHLRTLQATLAIAFLIPIALFAQDQTLMISPPCYFSCPLGINADPVINGSSPQVLTCSFVDPLPAGAELHVVTLTQSMGNGRDSPDQGTPTVSWDLNGTSLGPPQLITNYSTGCIAPRVWTFQSATYPAGFPGYIRGSNVLRTTISNGSLFFDAPQLILSYIVPIRTTVWSGNFQRAVVKSATELPLTARLTGPAGATLAGLTVRFAVATEPAHAGGTAIGADELAITRTYDATTDANGYARAIAILGDKEGYYTFSAAVPGGEQYGTTFTTNGQTPDSYLILKDTTDVSKQSATYAVSLWNPANFTLIGLDTNRVKIGPVKATKWTIANTQRGTTVSGSVATAKFTPLAPGDTTISANPVTAAKNTQITVPILVTQLYLLLGPPNPNDPKHDDLPTYVPGTTSTGASVLPSDMPQQVTIHVATTNPVPSGTNTVRLALLGTTTYPGIAMNYPIPGIADDDMYFVVSGQQQQNLTLTFDTAGDTKTVLSVNDYAAWAALKCTITTGGKDYVIDTSIPIDVNGNKIADTGWTAGATHVTDASLSGSADADNDPVVFTYPPEGVTGDLLTTLEEYRGFITEDTHIRTDPRKKDVFARLDDGLRIRVSFYERLPLAIHYVNAREVSGDIPPIVNPNIYGPPPQNVLYFPGASLQHAERGRDRPGVPDYVDPQTGLTVKNWDLWGHTYYCNEPTDVVTTANNTVYSTNDLAVVDVWFTTIRAHWLVDVNLDGFQDANALEHICDENGNRGPCDTYITRRDANGNLQAVKNLLRSQGPGEVMDDWQVHPAADDVLRQFLPDGCNGADIGLGPQATEALIKNTIAHELGHGVHIAHNAGPCVGSVMGDTGDANHPRRDGVYFTGVGTELVPSTYSTGDVYGIRLHSLHP